MFLLGLGLGLLIGVSIGVVGMCFLRASGDDFD